MLLSMENICDWAGGNLKQRNYVYAEKLLRAVHITKCGINAVQTRSDEVSFWAQCLSTSAPRDKPHDINGIIDKNGKVLSVKCSCKAGLGEKCKHSIAALLYCHR